MVNQTWIWVLFEKYWNLVQKCWVEYGVIIFLIEQKIVPFHHRKWKKHEDFFSISGRSVSKDTLLSEMEKKSKELFFITDVG